MRLIISIIFLCSLSVHAATIYCSPAGGGSGASFSDLATFSSASKARGNVLVLIEGSYGNLTFDTPASGTTPVTIRAVDPAQDSGVAGYSTTLFNDPVVFGSIFQNDPYLIMNGVRRTETTRMEQPQGYGMRITSINADSISTVDNADGSQFSYIEFGGTWSDSDEPNCADPNYCIRFVYDQNDITFTRCSFHNAGVNNGAIAMMHGASDITWDHCDFYMGWGKATIASPNALAARWTVKYCRFWNSSRLDDACGTSGGGITTEVGSYTTGVGTEHEGHQIYGNVFFGTASGNRNSSVQFGDGNASSGIAVDCLVYNNTFAGFPDVSVLGVVFLYSGTGNAGGNNLAYDINGSFGVTANTTFDNSEVMSDPFVDYANRDFRLAASTAVDGTSLPAPFNTDPSGTVRGTGGNWDIGAYQFESGGSSGAPNAFGHTARVGNVRAP